MVRVHNWDNSSDKPVWSGSSINGSILVSQLNPGSKYLVTLTDNGGTSGETVKLQLETLSLPAEMMAETRVRQEVKTNDITLVVMMTCLIVIVIMVIMLSTYLLLKRKSNNSEGMIRVSLHPQQGSSHHLAGFENLDQLFQPPLDMRDVCKVRF